MFIPDLDFFPSRIPDPGVKKSPDPGSATLFCRERFGQYCIMDPLSWCLFLCILPVWPNQWWFDQWLFFNYVPVWPNQWWFDQWLFVWLCTCLAQPMVVRPMGVGRAVYLFGPTNGGSTNGCWVWYLSVWPNQWFRPMVVGCGMYLFGPTDGSNQLPVIEISQQGHRLQGGGQCWVNCSWIQ